MAITDKLTENRPMGASSHFTSVIMLSVSATIPKIAYGRLPTAVPGPRVPTFAACDVHFRPPKFHGMAIRWPSYAACGVDAATSGFSPRKGVEISRFCHLLPVTLRTKLRRHFIGRFPNAHYRANGTMCCHAVPRAERHAVIDS